MVDKEKKSTMKGFETNDQTDYYSRITSITVNGNNAYELKGKFLDDLHKNAFSGTNGEDAVEHIEYFLKIDLPNDSELKEEALRNKAIMEGLINEDVESNNEENEERCELFDDTTQELPVCTVRRFEMIKYSSGQDEEYVALKEEEYEDLFGQDEEYLAVKEDEYEDSTSTSKDACRAYQKIFRMMDEGWMINSRAKVPSHKTTNRNKPEKKISVAKKPERQIPTGHRFSIKKTSVVHEKTKTPRSCLRWKPTGRILKIVGLRWVLTGNIFTSSTTTVDSKPPHGSNTYITNLHECIQTLDSSAGTSINVQEEQNLDLSTGTPFNLKKERIKVCIKENVISGRPRLHGVALIQEISARQKYKQQSCSLTPAEYDSLPHAHAQTTKTYYKHQDSRIKKAQELKTKTFANSDIIDNSSETKLWGRLLERFQEDEKYEHVGQDIRSQGGKDDHKEKI
ncbi:hypothetical protein Tco_0926451 [Tanacetum coccineum]|uniref:Uncharacterized protein n=1 Tax=Tanacetum coccineum TaxID=301880 RepID=A0ABQ5DCG5_9ASTR